MDVLRQMQMTATQTHNHAICGSTVTVVTPFSVDTSLNVRKVPGGYKYSSSFGYTLSHFRQTPLVRPLVL